MSKSEATMAETDTTIQERGINHNNPNFIVDFTIGDPFPNFKAQDSTKESLPKLSGIYYDGPKRFILKKASFSFDDNRIFDVDSGKIVMVSHHPGKNPYEAIDPLGIVTDPLGLGRFGEWESKCYVTGYQGYPKLKLRPKTISRTGRQYIYDSENDEVIMTIGKLSKFKTLSFRPHFGVTRGKDQDDIIYTCKADMLGRTISIYNTETNELVAQISKTTKALIQMATSLGSGSESLIDIAPGVDCSVILAIVYGIGQVGKHFVNDAFKNLVVDPIKGSLVGSTLSGAGVATYEVLNDDVIVAAGAEEGGESLVEAVGEAVMENAVEDLEENWNALQEVGAFIFETFFQ